MKNLLIAIITFFILIGGLYYNSTTGVEKEQKRLDVEYYNQNVTNAVTMHLLLLQQGYTIPVPVIIEMDWSGAKHARAYVNQNPRFKNKPVAIWATNQNLVTRRKSRLITMKELYESDLQRGRFDIYTETLKRTSN